MNDLFLYSALLIIILLLYFHRKNNKKYDLEHYSANEFAEPNYKFDVTKPVDVDNQYPVEFRSFSQNYDKKWKDLPVANGNQYVQNIPPYGSKIKSPDELVINYLQDSEMVDVLKRAAGRFPKTQISFGEIKDELSQEELNKYNKETTMKQEINFNPNLEENFIVPQSSIPGLTDFMNNLLTNINKSLVTSKFMADREIKFGTLLFAILNYKLKSVKKDTDDRFKYEIMVDLLRKTNYFTYTVYAEIIYNPNRNFNQIKYRLVKLDLVGKSTTDENFLKKPNDEKFNDKVYLNPEYRRTNDIDISNLSEIYKKNKENWNRITNKNQYSCFNNDYNERNKLLIQQPNNVMASSKSICEDKYDWYGRPKPHGVWDRPCKTDKDCIFHKSNKNYPNNFGKCNKDSGKCELPKNVEPLGYRYFFPNEKPLCYNCKSSFWQAITELGECCEEQKDKKKYPFLETPDYAFSDDKADRINYRNQLKYIDKIQNRVT